jgi:hypothetical protein
MTNPDIQIEILHFAAEHHAILASQTAALLNGDHEQADQTLAQLTTAGRLRWFGQRAGEPGAYLITRRGLAAIDSPLPEPRIETVRDPQTQLALPWLTLIARRGKFGAYEQILTERVMRHHDHTRADGPRPADRCEASEPQPGQPFGITLTHPDNPTGARYYPPLMLETPKRYRVALELQTRQPSTPAITEQLRGYAQHPNIEIVLYLVNDDAVGHRIQQLADQLHVGELVRVQRARLTPDAPDQTL